MVQRRSLTGEKSEVCHVILKDEARWDGITFVTNPVGGKMPYKGNIYANDHEVLLAKLLHHLKIPFTPHVRVLLEHPDGSRRPYHPDFLFNGVPYVWTSPRTGKAEIIHGIEAKSRAGGTIEPEKKRLLREQYGINVIILDNKAISSFHTQRFLPMAPYFIS